MEHTQKNLPIIHRIIKGFKSPISSFIGFGGGILTGQFYPEFSIMIFPLNQVILNILALCVIPILFTAVSLSIANFLTAQLNIKLGKSLLIFTTLFFLASSIGLFTALFMRPGYEIDPEASAKLKEVSIENARIQRHLDEPIENKSNKNPLIQILQKIVPQNILRSMVMDHFFQVLLFSLIFGCALATIQQKNYLHVTMVLQTVQDIFEKIYTIGLTLMPIVIFLIMASNFSTIGPETFLGMLPYILSLYLAFFIMFLIMLGLIAYKLHINLFKALGMIQEPLIIALVTTSGIAAMPSAIHTLTQSFKIDKSTVNMLASIGLVLGEFGMALYFSFSCLFIAQYYGHNLAEAPVENLENLFIIVGLSTVAALASTGSPSKLSLGSMTLILDLFGLPLSAFLVLLMFIDYIIDPFRSAILLQGNIAAIVTLAGKPLTQKPSEIV